MSSATIPADGGAIPTYIALPTVTPAPVVVIFASIFGVDADTCAWADRYAEAGFIALVPDFFWRTIPGPMRAEIPEERAKATERNAAFDHEAGVRDMAAVRDYANAMPQSNGKWAVAGYCFGGRYTLLAATQLGADAVAGFHPSRMHLELEAAAALTCPASYHFGGADESVPMDVVETIVAALATNPRAEYVIYPGVPHGFSAKSRPLNYRADVAESSFTLALKTLNTLK